MSTPMFAETAIAVGGIPTGQSGQIEALGPAGSVHFAPLPFGAVSISAERAMPGMPAGH